MNLTQLKYFIEIYETQSITIAANNLFVTQPTLSLSLKKFEETLGTRLFIRSGNEYLLTEHGEIVYNEGKAILQKIDQLNQTLEEARNTSEEETIRLGMTTLYSLQFMNEISTYMATHPKVKLSIVQDGSYRLQQMLANNLLDIALVSMPNFQANKINIEPLTTSTKGYTIYVVLPKTNPLAKRASLTFKDLEAQRFSSLTENFIIGRMLLARTRELGQEANVVAFHNDLQILLHSLVQSDSICLLPIEYNRIYHFDDLQWVPLDDKYNYYQIGIGTPKNRPQTHNIIEFIEILKEN